MKIDNPKVSGGRKQRLTEQVAGTGRTSRASRVGGVVEQPMSSSSGTRTPRERSNMDNPKVRSGPARQGGAFIGVGGGVNTGALQHYFDNIRDHANRQLTQMERKARRLGDRLGLHSDAEEGTQDDNSAMGVGVGERPDPRRSSSGEEEGQRFDNGVRRVSGGGPEYGEGQPFDNGARQAGREDEYRIAGGPSGTGRAFDGRPFGQKSGIDRSHIEQLASRIRAGDLSGLDELLRLLGHQ